MTTRPHSLRKCGIITTVGKSRSGSDIHTLQAQLSPSGLNLSFSKRNFVLNLNYQCFFSFSGPRTTNHLEGWHSKLNKKFNAPHPNIFVFIEVLLDIQAEVEVEVQLLALGGPPPRKRRKVICIEEKHGRLRQRLLDGKISPLEYVDSVGHLLSPS